MNCKLCKSPASILVGEVISEPCKCTATTCRCISSEVHKFQLGGFESGIRHRWGASNKSIIRLREKSETLFKKIKNFYKKIEKNRQLDVGILIFLKIVDFKKKVPEFFFPGPRAGVRKFRNFDRILDIFYS